MESKSLFDSELYGTNECSICFENITKPSHPDACNHIFCSHCLSVWEEIKNFCPICKRAFKKIITIEVQEKFEEHKLDLGTSAENGPSISTSRDANELEIIEEVLTVESESESSQDDDQEPEEDECEIIFDSSL